MLPTNNKPSQPRAQQPNTAASHPNPLLRGCKVSPSPEKPYNPSATYKFAHSVMLKDYPDLTVNGVKPRSPDEPEDFDCRAYPLTEAMIKAATTSDEKPATQ